jgi:hypothetical protein
MDSEAHSICEFCVQVFVKHGTVFTGTVHVQECCFCGHEHKTGQFMRLDDGPDGVRVRPWWCADKLGIHRQRGMVMHA